LLYLLRNISLSLLSCCHH